ncbi:hypothetical protein [Cryobacterium sp. PH29-G1]|uniref:hypothetical protein n=1 Tax=Cryobacterium sp. PH29-G1 TaxID=3046211 RepID=UPI0024BB37A2|nr:hypothetical protein [Cryobacterium sp. PH29-G1]MDJ0349674.1 hypothetical protein [Cryobacterium sp. PH29-G1]
MRDPALWIGLASILGPLLLGILFVPVGAAIFAVGLQIAHKGKGIAVGTWVSGLTAVILAIIIYPAHFDSVAACDAIAARDSVTLLTLLGDNTDSTRLEMLEAGCNDLPFYTMPTR